MLEASLKARALKALYNTDEISDDVVKKASNDALEISKNKQIALFYVEDFAYIRLKIYLKIELSGEDELLLKEATTAIKNAPFISDDGELKSSVFRKVGAREEFL